MCSVICVHAIAGNKESYTIFIATDFAIASMLPQDVGDPMYTDSSLRRDVLMAHIARQRVSSDDILRRSIVVMANNMTAQISRQGGKWRHWVATTLATVE